MVNTLEVGVGFGGLVEEREELLGERVTKSGLGDLVLGAKWNPIPEDRGWASHALAFTLKLPTADHHSGFGSGETDFDVTYLASKSLGPRLGGAAPCD